MASLDARAVAESHSLMMQLTFDEWVRRIDDDRGATLRAVHEDVVAALARSTAGA